MSPIEQYCSRRALLFEHWSTVERFAAGRDLSQFNAPPHDLLALPPEDICLHNFHLIKHYAIKYTRCNRPIRAIWDELIEAGFVKLVAAAHKLDRKIRYPVGYLRAAIKNAMLDVIKEYESRSSGDFELIEQEQNREGKTGVDNKLAQWLRAPKCGDLVKAHDKLLFCCDDFIDRDILYVSWQKDPNHVLSPKKPQVVANDLGLSIEEVIDRLNRMRQEFEQIENLIRKKQKKKKFESRPWAFALAS